MTFTLALLAVAVCGGAIYFAIAHKGRRVVYHNTLPGTGVRVKRPFSFIYAAVPLDLTFVHSRFAPQCSVHSHRGLTERTTESSHVGENLAEAGT